jgi:hypothetical protein
MSRQWVVTALALLAVVPPAHAKNTNALVTARGKHLRFEILAPAATGAVVPDLRIFYRDPRTVVRSDPLRFRHDRWIASPPVPTATTDATFSVMVPTGGGVETWFGRYRTIPSKERIQLFVDSPDGSFRATVPPEIAAAARLFVVGTGYLPAGAIPAGYEAVSEPWHFGIGHLAKAERGVDVRFQFLAALGDDAPLDPRLADGTVVIFTDAGGSWHSIPTDFNPFVGAAGFPGRFDATYVATVPVP